MDMPYEGNIDIMSPKYWLVYFANATMTTLLPIFWSDGFDVPPFMVPVPLPAVYVPIGKPLLIKPIGVMIVFGIAIRGIWPAPIILTINMTSQDINAMTPVMVAMNVTKMKFQQRMTKLEMNIPKIVNGVLNKIIGDNADMKKRLDKFRTYSSLIKSQHIDNEGLIAKEFQEAKDKGASDGRQVVTRLDKLGEGSEPN